MRNKALIALIAIVKAHISKYNIPDNPVTFADLLGMLVEAQNELALDEHDADQRDEALQENLANIAGDDFTRLDH